MNAIRTIRNRLGLTQQALAEVLDVTQGNVSLYEHGQEVPPKVARRLIAFANQRGERITLDYVYGIENARPELAQTEHEAA